MAARAQMLWDPKYRDYFFGAGHPMQPVRLELTYRLAESLGVLDRLEVRAPRVASVDELALAHDREFIAAVRTASADPKAADVFGQAGAYGLATDDVPAFAGMHEAAARAVGGTLAAAEAVWSGAAHHAVNISGGLHHANRAAAAGFCVYNDCAVAVARLRELGARRVVYIDVDVHHGDGTEAIFWDDPDVLTISLHESPQTLYPGTGWPTAIGGPAAQGRAVNVALPAGTGDDVWLRAFDAVVPALLAEFRPDAIVSQHGADTHLEDPLAHLAMSVDAHQAMAVRIRDLAIEHCPGKWVATGGGGYEVVDVVPRSWTHLIAVVAGCDIATDTAVPQAWRDYVTQLLGRRGPVRMSDGKLARLHAVRDWADGFNPDSDGDRAIMATRQAVFPHWGLDPLHD